MLFYAQSLNESKQEEETNMTKKWIAIILMALLCLCVGAALAEDVPIDAANFPDEIFRAYVKQEFDTDGNGSLSGEEIKAAKEIDVSQKKITSLQGIKYFTALEYLYCDRNNLSSLDVSSNKALCDLRCYENKLTSLNVSGNTALALLWCYDNKLSTLDVSANKALEDFQCYNNPLSSLDVSANNALIVLQCDYALMSKVKRGSTNVAVVPNRVTTADGTVNLSAFPGLDVSKTHDWAGGEVEGNVLTVWNNNSSVYFIYKGVGISIDIDIEETKPTPTVAPKPTAVPTAEPTSEPDGIAIDAVHFPDEVFRTYVKAVFDSDENSSLSSEEIEAATIIDLEESKVVSLQGIEYLAALRYLYCFDSSLTSLDVSKNPALAILGCWNNSLTSLDLSGNPALAWLYCEGNSISSLDVSKNPALVLMTCDYALMNKVSGGKDVAIVPGRVSTADGTVDLSSFPGFDVSKASEWEGGTVEGNTLTVKESGTVSFAYENGSAAFDVVIEAAKAKPGDVTGDGKTDIMDVIRLLKKVSGWEVEIEDSAADVTGDGKVNIMDVIRLLKFVSGWSVTMN